MSTQDSDHAVGNTGRGSLPQRRRDGLVVEEVGDETLVFDSENDVAHCLSPDAALVWRACDGEHDVAGLAALTGAGEASVADALDALNLKGLLSVRELDRVPGFSRRWALKRIGAVGIAASSVPLIVSATIGAPLAHASGGTAGMCDTCMISGSNDSCVAGYLCDPDNLVCIPEGCEFSSCTPGGTCDGGLGRGVCQDGCSAGGALCC
jgi:hypothetical protein